MTFEQLQIIPKIQRALKDATYTKATPIQEKAIPHILAQKDVLACAQTGTGKTAAFAIPILQQLNNNHSKSRNIEALIVTPTRELAIQVEESFKMYSTYLNQKTLAIYGGVSQNPQVDILKKGVQVLVATPGRLLDLIQQSYIDISKIKILVLDEADQMLDMGFVNDVKKIIAKVPAKRQTLFFSATMPKAIRKFANSILKNPEEVTINPAVTVAQSVHQSVYFVEKKEKSTLLAKILNNKSIRRSLVFTRTKYGADKLVKRLNKIGVPAAAIHGNKSQNARQIALGKFKDSQIRVLVATDIAARGIDIDELPYVINYELPNVPETYVHRIGRTGRAGNKGVAISFCDNEERKDLENIQKLIGFKIPSKIEKTDMATKQEIFETV